MNTYPTTRSINRTDVKLHQLTHLQLGSGCRELAPCPAKLYCLCAGTPPGSVGASASQRCPLDTRAPMDPAAFEKAGETLLFMRGAPRPARSALLLRRGVHWTPASLACRLGRRFCFAEVSAGHPRVSPAGSVGASASQRCPLDTRAL